MSTNSIQFVSNEQNMWATGDAFALHIDKYFPIIGGEKTEWTVENLAVSGGGEATASGDRITYDPLSAFKKLGQGRTETVTITYDLTAPGKEAMSREVEITVTGTDGGASFSIPKIGKEVDLARDLLDRKAEGGSFTFAAASAEDMLQDHTTLIDAKPVDIDWDLVADMHAVLKEHASTVEERAAHENSVLAATEDEIARLEKMLADTVNYGVTYAKYEALDLVIDGEEAAQAAFEKLEKLVADLDLEKRAAEAEHLAATAAKDAAHAAFWAAHGAVSTAKTAASAAKGAVDTAFNALGWLARGLGLDGVDSGLRNAKEAADKKFNDAQLALDHAQSALDRAEAAERRAIDKVEHVALKLTEAVDHLATQGAHLEEEAYEAMHEAHVRLRDQLHDELLHFFDDDVAAHARTRIPELRAEMEPLAAVAELAQRYEEEDEALEYHFHNWFGNFFFRMPGHDAQVERHHDEIEAKARALGYDTYAHLFEDLAHKQGEVNTLQTIVDHPTNHLLTPAALADELVLFKERVARATENRSLLEIAANEAGHLKDKVFDLVESFLDTSAAQLEAYLHFEMNAQAGIQLNITLDAGHVDSDLRYDLTLDGEIDAKSGDLSLMPMLSGFDPSDESLKDHVAFKTISPNLEIHVGLMHDIGGSVEARLDALVEILDHTIIDIHGPDGPGTAIVYKDEFGMSGNIDLIEFKSAGELVFKPTIPVKFGDFDPNDLITLEIQFPTIKTEGKLDDPDLEDFKDPPFFDLAKLAEELIDISKFKLGPSAEYKKFLQLYAADDQPAAEASFLDLVVQAGKHVLDLATKAINDSRVDLDTDGTIPIIEIARDAPDTPLVHINTFEDIADREGFSFEEIGQFGYFHAPKTASNNLFEFTLDVDQLLWTVLAVATAQPELISKNPFDLSLSLSDIFGGDEDGDGDEPAAPAETDLEKEAESKYGLELNPEDPFSLDIHVEALDLDLILDGKFTQEFALSVEDMQFAITVEGNDEVQFFDLTEEVFLIEKGSYGDVNLDGKIDYDIDLTPSAQFMNDTEFALTLKPQLDLLKTKMAMAVNMDWAHVASAVLPFDLPHQFGFAAGLGPVLRADVSLDLLTVDVFEDMFDYDAGTASVSGSVKTGIVHKGGKGDDTHEGSVHDDHINGGGGHDDLSGGRGDDILMGGGGKDVLDGGKGNDLLLGGGGNDKLSGGGGHDWLDGGGGKDALKGGGGRDVLDGGRGADVLSGGKGADVFVLSKKGGEDTITDFGKGDSFLVSGLSGFRKLKFSEKGDDVQIKVGKSKVLVEDVTLEDIQVSEFFEFL